MLIVLLLKGLRFFFYSNEGTEPAHIHVMKGGAEGKIWLEPEVEIAYLHRFSKNEEKDIGEAVLANQDYFKQK
jgi:hypothetical protein